MEDCSFVVGQEFPNVKAFRNAVKEAAIAQHFELRIIKSDLVRYYAKCATEGCPWRIRATKVADAPTFSVRSIETTHTCGRNVQYRHQQASVDWIVKFIEERLRDNINYKPKDILDDIYEKYGITIPYKQAWRAKERGLMAIYGSSEEGYYLLPSYCEQIRLTNPGSAAEVFTSGADNRFHSLFISLYGSIYGFLNGCLPIVCLGAVQLTSKYMGTLLLASSYDPDGGLFPLAFGIIDVASDETWKSFLSELHNALELNMERIPQLTFISDGQNGVMDAVKKKFPSCSHAFCVKFLTETISKEFKNSRLGQLLGKAAGSTTTVGFKEKMAEIEEVSPEASSWLKKFPPSKWALLYFEGTRFGHLSSNTDEYARWVLDTHELSVYQMIERIHTKLMSKFAERRGASGLLFSVLTPNAEKLMAEATSRSSTYKVLRSDEVEFEVLSGERSHIVNIGTRSCSCRNWQLYGVPCSHAVAAIIFSRKDVYAFVENCFTVASFREAYKVDIHPIPDKVEWVNGGNPCLDDDIWIVRPPKLRRPPGRPEKKRLRVEDLTRVKHTVHCSRCNQTGHYKTTCKGETVGGSSSL